MCDLSLAGHIAENAFLEVEPDINGWWNTSLYVCNPFLADKDDKGKPRGNQSNRAICDETQYAKPTKTSTVVVITETNDVKWVNERR